MDRSKRPEFGLAEKVLDEENLARCIKVFKDQNIVLPTLEQLQDPRKIPADIQDALKNIGPDEAHPLNLFRVHWYNGPDRKTRVDVPGYIALPPSLTGVPSTILVAVGCRFPMINAHKVLAAYGCLAPRLVTGQFDPTKHRAIWPSTGNYCRGGVAISRIMGCRSSAILPEGMSRERFEWLERWVADPSDIVRTFGTESNVKEIYDACNALSKSKENFLFNQFSDFGNHLTHYTVTGPALKHIVEDHAAKTGKKVRLAAFTSATGSAGCIAAGDYLKAQTGSKTIAIESVECPTMLQNGFGEHNIQGIGDKHIPLIHNIVGTDLICGISDHETDQLTLVFNSEVGQKYLRERGVPADVVSQLPMLGYSGIANMLGAVKAARYYGLGPDDVLVTVATDSAALYASEVPHLLKKHFNGPVTPERCGEAYGRAILGASNVNMLELTELERRRVFNLAYYTWVEQQGVSVEEFEARRDPKFWTGLHDLVPVWDRLIRSFNDKTGVNVPKAKL